MSPERVAEFGFDETGAHAVDSDLFEEQFFGQNFGHDHECGLGDRVVADHTARFVCAHAGDNDDRASLLLAEVGESLFDEEEGRFVVDFEHLLDLVV